MDKDRIETLFRQRHRIEMDTQLEKKHIHSTKLPSVHHDE